MEHNQAPRAEHVESELPDAGGIQVQAACSTVERLQTVPAPKMQGQVDHQFPRL